MTAQQDIFPKKPKDVITPLTPKHVADAIRAKAQPAPEPTKQEAALEELEELAAQNALKRPVRRKTP